MSLETQAEKSFEKRINIDTKISLLMKSLTEFYKNPIYIKNIKEIIEQNSVVSLRILDWFITNYSKKNRTLINTDNKHIDVYQHYKLQLKSFSKNIFDPFCRKNKIIFYYNENEFIETSCGQLCFFRWCFENDILLYVNEHLNVIEQDMKNSLKRNKKDKATHKRKPLSINASRTISKHHDKTVITFD